MAADKVILGPTIDHLRANCPIFSGRVAGAADYVQGLRNYNENMTLPAAYVVPLAQDAEAGQYGPNQQMTGLYEIVDKVTGVIVEFDARTDRRGQVPAMQYDEVEAALFAALLNWTPVGCVVPNKQGYAFQGGRFLDLDRARLFYQWEFLLRYQLTDEDGWQDTEGEDLRSIEIDIFHKEGAAIIEAPPDVPAAIVRINMWPFTVWDDATTWDDGLTVWDPPKG
jgi:hypothetical protein